MPLRLKSKYLLAKYFAKLTSYCNQHRTSDYVRNWNNNHRLKKESLLSRTESQGWLRRNVEPVSLPYCPEATANFSGRFFFRIELDSRTKTTQYPKYKTISLITYP